MTTAALIDLVLNYTDNVTATDGDNTVRRTRVLQWCQEVFDLVYAHKAWPFRYITGDVTTVNGLIVVPADFHDFGDEGGVFNPLGERMMQVNPKTIHRMREAGEVDPNPSLFALYGFDASTARPNINIVNTTSSVVLTLWYLKVAPTLADSTTPGTSNLFYIPAAYHNSVLLAGVVARTRRAKGDTRNWQADFERGLAEMVKNERPRQTGIQRLPKAINGMW